MTSTGISWAQINTENVLSQWNYENFSSLPTKMAPVEIFNLVIITFLLITVVLNVPKTYNLYIFVYKNQQYCFVCAANATAFLIALYVVGRQLSAQNSPE